MPCFGKALAHNATEDSSVKDNTLASIGGLKRCKATRCTIPGCALPRDRSAHTMTSIAATNSEHGASLLVFGGEAPDGSRLSDAWKLTPPSKGWNESIQSSRNISLPPKLGTSPTWEKLQCGKIYGENVPTPRSNHAAVVCGDHFLVFGGWHSNGVEPLSHCELLHLDTLCWTHCSTREGMEPPPRGNPTLVYFECIHSAVLFGGWNGERRFNDAWFLDMTNWKWDQIQASHGSDWPARRTDHSAVLWKYASGEANDVMIVFGGSVDGCEGSSSELWALECCLKVDAKSSQCAVATWRWSQLEALGPIPPARTSHAATVVGRGDSAKMVVVGGTDATSGSGQKGLLRDAWILSMSRDKGRRFQCKWEKLDWDGCGVDRCRHAVVAVGGGPILAVWGGFDGEATVSEDATLFLGDVEKEGGTPAVTAPDVPAPAVVPVMSCTVNDDATSRHLQERWAAEVPVTADDLPAAELSKAQKSRLPGAIWKALHRFAVAKGRDTYIDPSSGYSVFTQVYLKRRQCCGNGCRHCPFGHVNVPKKGGGAEALPAKASLDW